ncbi:T9SS type A sorting domain-containing protein [archaeon]|nr:T9SS type A sorting domain-containing protein [archaeon]
MKDLTKKLGKFVKDKVLKPAVFTVGILGSVYGAKAQDIWENPEIKAAMNFYSQPNLHIVNGKDSLEYYGSGDVNLDKSVNYLDAEAIRNGTHNVIADVKGDSIQGDEADAQMIENYLAGNISYLPGKDYNHLNRSEKIEWIKKMLRIDDSNRMYVPGEVCADFVTRANYHFRGGGDSEGIDDPNIAFNPDAVGRFNIPAFYGSTIRQSATTGETYGHALLVFFVGEEEMYSGTPTKLEDYVAFDIQNRDGDLEVEEIQPGSLRMRDYLGIQVITKFNNYLPLEILRFDFPDNDGNYMVNINPFFQDHILMSNPNAPDTIPPTYTPSDNVTVSFNELKEKGLEQIIEENNPKDVKDNVDPNPVTSYTYSSNQTNNQSYNDFNFDTEIEFRAVDKSGNDSTSNYTISIRDQEKPKFTYIPMDANITSNQSMEPSELGVAEATDNTEVPVNISYSDEQIGEDNLYKYFSRKWTAKDISNLSIDSVQYINQQKPTGFDNVNDLEKKLYFAYPNPFIDKVKINTNPSSMEKTHIKIYSTDGRLQQVYTEEGFTEQVELDLSKLNTGIYLMQITQDGKTSTQKILKK